MYSQWLCAVDSIFFLYKKTEKIILIDQVIYNYVIKN